MISENGHNSFKSKNFSSKNEVLSTNLDLHKINHVIGRNILWVLLILFSSVFFSYLFLRYTKPVYESASEIRLEEKSEANLLAINTIQEDKEYNNISREIELIKSTLFFKKVIEVLDLDVTYYSIGKVLDEERYNSSPFKVDFEILDLNIYDKRFNIDLIDKNQFHISFESGGKVFSGVYSYGDLIEDERFKLILSKTSKFREDDSDGDYYFLINSEKSLINYFEKNVTVEPVNLNANTIRIAIQSHNTHKSRDFVNAIDTLYLKYTQEKKNEANQRKIEYLNTQIRQTEDKLAEFENYFENFTIDNRTIDLDSDMSKYIVSIEKLDSQKFVISEALGKVNVLHEKLSSADFEDINLSTSIGFPKNINLAIEDLSSLLDEKKVLLSSYSPSTFVVKKKEQEINILSSKLLSLLDRYNLDYTKRLDNLNKSKKRLEGEFAGLPSKGTEFGKVKRYYDLYEKIYLSIVEKKNEFEVAKAGTVPNFVILSPATLPESAIYPNKIMIYGIGVVAGFIFSIMFVGIKYLLHNRVTTLIELEQLTTAPVLGVIPRYSKEKIDTTKLIVNKNPKSMISESLRSIRTDMAFLSFRENKKVVSVTSTISGEGKTFVSVNLGAIIAMSNQKVVILDLDMRKPKVHIAFSGNNSEKGVSTILINKYKLDDCINHSEVDNLDYITAGPVPPNPSELIGSDALKNLLEDLKKKYDLIILDTPPVGLVTDGVLAMKKADLHIYIVRSDFSKKSFIKTVNRLIEVNRFDNLALILNSYNAIRKKRGAYGYGYGYGYGYYAEDHNKNESVISSIKKIFNKERV